MLANFITFIFKQSRFCIKTFNNIQLLGGLAKHYGLIFYVTHFFRTTVLILQISNFVFILYTDKNDSDNVLRTYKTGFSINLTKKSEQIS